MNEATTMQKAARSQRAAIALTIGIVILLVGLGIGLRALFGAQPVEAIEDEVDTEIVSQDIQDQLQPALLNTPAEQPVADQIEE